MPGGGENYDMVAERLTEWASELDRDSLRAAQLIGAAARRAERGPVGSRHIVEAIDAAVTGIRDVDFSIGVDGDVGQATGAELLSAAAACP